MDKLKLLDNTIPLQGRYDSFVVWCNQHASNIPEVISEQLGVSVGVVDVFFELGGLDPEEFDIIDKKKIDIDSLFLIARKEKSIRLKVYEKSDELLNSNQPLNAIRIFIDQITIPDFNLLIQKITPKVWGVISKYLKERDIISGTINKKFRSMLVNAIKAKNTGKNISEPMVNWIMRGIAHDKEKELNIFTNEILQKEYPNDFIILNQIISQIDLVVETNESSK